MKKIILGFLLLVSSFNLHAQLGAYPHFPSWVTNSTFADATNLLAYIRANTAIRDQNVTNIVSVTNVTYGDITNLLAQIKANSAIVDRNVTNTVTVTNVTLASIQSALNSLSNRIEQVFDTNSAALGTNGLRTIPAGYVPANNAINTVNIQEALSSTYGGDGTWELLSGVSTNTTGEWSDVSRYKNFTFMICPTTVTNHQIFIDATLNSGTNWYNIYSATITNTNTILIQWANYKLQKIRGRALITNELDTLRGFGGN